MTIPAIDSPIDARPSLLALPGCDTAVLLAISVHTLNTCHTWWYDTTVLFTVVWPAVAFILVNVSVLDHQPAIHPATHLGESRHGALDSSGATYQNHLVCLNKSWVIIECTHKTQPNTFYSLSRIKKLMCFIINSVLLFVTVHIYGPKNPIWPLWESVGYVTSTTCPIVARSTSFSTFLGSSVSILLTERHQM